MTSKGNAQDDPGLEQVRSWVASWRGTLNAADFDAITAFAYAKCIKVIESGVLEGKSKPAGFLHTVASNAARDWWRMKLHRPLNTTDVDHEWQSDGVDPGDVAIERVEAKEILEIARSCLPPADTELLALRYYYGLPLSSIARQLGMNENTTKVRAARKLAVVRSEVLRRRLGVGEISSHASVMLGFVDLPPALVSEATRQKYLTPMATPILSRIGDEYWRVIGATVAAGGPRRGMHLESDELAAYQTFCCLLAHDYLQQGYTLASEPDGKTKRAQRGIPAPLPELLRPFHFGMPDGANVRQATVRALLLHMDDDARRHAAVSALQRYVGADPDLATGPVRIDDSPLGDLARLVRREANIR